VGFLFLDPTDWQVAQSARQRVFALAEERWHLALTLD